MTNKTEIALSPNCILSIEQALYCVGKENRPHIQKAIIDKLSSLSGQLEAAKSEIAELEQDKLRLNSVINTEANRAEAAEARIAELENRLELVRMQRDAELTTNAKLEAEIAELRGTGDSSQWRMDIINMRNLLTSDEWAEHVAKTPSGSGLEVEITKLVSAISELRGAAVPVAEAITPNLAAAHQGHFFKLHEELFTHPAPPLVVLQKYARNKIGQMTLNGKAEPRVGFGSGWNAAVDALNCTVKSADGEVS